MALFLFVAIVVSGVRLFRDTDAIVCLLPGDPEITAAALDELRQDLYDGQPIQEALTAFCREIIDGAHLPE